jgi:hypothetical protein
LVWHPPSVAIQIAGEAYLKSIFDKDQIALFRVMIRDAHKFPKLASRYQRGVLKSRNMRFVRYLEQWKKENGGASRARSVPQMFLVLFCAASSLKRLFWDCEHQTSAKSTAYALPKTKSPALSERALTVN